MFGKILVATDFSESSRAAMYAALSLAKKCLAGIEVVHVVTYLEDMYNFSRFGVPDWDWQQSLRHKLEEFFPPQIYPNSQRKLIVGHSPTREILQYATEQGCGLIVIGYHGHSALSTFLMGSVSAQIMRLSEVPVLIVKAAANVEQRYQGFERVLVPTDFSDPGHKALEFGIRLANFLKADLHLIHVVDLPAMQEFKKNYPQGQITVDESSEWNVDLVLKKMVDDKKMVGNTFISTLTGDPVEQILWYAKRKEIDFIVMGTHGRKGLDRLLLGSTTSGVVAKSDIPVITVSRPQ